MHACITPLLASPGRVHDPAECDDIANAVADRLCHDNPDAYADKSSDPIALADRTSVVRSAQRTFDQCRVGARRGNSPLPID
jgi:hypothetical protein